MYYQPDADLKFFQDGGVKFEFSKYYVKAKGFSTSQQPKQQENNKKYSQQQD